MRSNYIIAESSTRKRVRIPRSTVYNNDIPKNAVTLPPGKDCVKCGAKKFAFESRQFCCRDGEVHIVANETPLELVKLFNGKDNNSMHFRSYMRIYNNLFAFSSLGGKIKNTSEKGIYVFRLLGQLYHYVPNLLPSDDNPKYLQLYFYDAEHELERRLGSFPNLNPEIMSIIIDLMERNPYATFFRSLRDFDIVDNTEIIISQNPTLDQRVYNAPTSNEVAAILLSSTGPQEKNSPHIIVFGKSNKNHRVMHYYGCYDPLQYPILHPHGESGWHQGLKKRSNRRRETYCNETFPISSALIQTEEDLILEEEKVSSKRPAKDGKEISCREYYAYKLQIRPGNILQLKILTPGRLSLILAD